VVTLGHSGGGALYAYYHQQSGSAPEQRIAATPAGRPSGLPEAELPRPDGAVFLAPHPGPGQLMMSCIDPSVADEADPLSVRPELDPFDPANAGRLAVHLVRAELAGRLRALRPGGVRADALAGADRRPGRVPGRLAGRAGGVGGPPT
jgi:hypothetical protein